MLHNILREIIPLTPSDCCTIFKRKKTDFDFPLHSHEEYELNFIHNAPGARRIIGNHIGDTEAFELVLVGPNLPHVWETHQCTSEYITEITIQFPKDLLDEKFLRRHQMSFIRKMLELSSLGILFSQETARELMPRLDGLGQKQGFDSILELLSILHDLSTSRNLRSLSDAGFANDYTYTSRRIEKVVDYVNNNFHRNISLSDAAKLVHMNDMSFSRFFKARTGISFMDNLLECRIGNATRLLIDTSQSVADIAYNCGFNNISNFNRLFKKRKGCTPMKFRETYFFYGNRRFI
ncbi:AraC family transcriptional regulator [Niabella terrae]